MPVTTDAHVDDPWLARGRIDGKRCDDAKLAMLIMSFKVSSHAAAGCGGGGDGGGGGAEEEEE